MVSSKKPSNFVIIAPIIITGLIISTAYLALQLKSQPLSHNSDEELLCASAECTIAAGEMLQGLDPDVNPCQDFYQFACGKWEEKHPLPQYYSSWNQFSILDDRLNRKIKGILESNLSTNEPQSLHMAQAFYNSCMWHDQKQGELALVKLIEEELRVGDTTEKGWSSTLGKLRRHLGASVLLNLYIFLDERNSTQNIIYIDQPVLGLAPILLLDEEHPNRYYYQVFIEQTWQLLYPEDDWEQVAQEILQLETNLARILGDDGEEEKDANYFYNEMRLTQLAELTENATVSKGRSVLEIIVPGTWKFQGLNWTNFVGEVFSGVDVNLGHIPDLKVVVRDTKYYKKLGSVLQQTNETTIVNYLRWGVVLGLKKFVGGKLKEIVIQFEKNTDMDLYNKRRWGSCAYEGNSYFGMAISYKYVKEVFKGDFEKQMDEMIGNIQKSFLHTIENAEWIGGRETRSRARGKAEGMKKFVGYPSWLVTNTSALKNYYKGLSLTQPENYFRNVIDLYYWLNLQELQQFGKPKDSDQWVTDPTTVNAFYSFGDNSITFPAGILQVPFYFTGSPVQALNYGGIGAVIGHEIIHGFDNTGRQVDEQGNLANWWDETTIFEYVTREQCFIDQYSQYEFSAPEVNTTKLNGLNTLGENIADNGGLRQAFNAYMKYIEEHGAEPHLPGVHYTPQQLFFLSFAQLWCGSLTAEAMENQLKTGAHSPGRFRVKGVLQNSPEFATAWNCSVPEEEEICSIW